MRIVVPVENEKLCPHFGHCASFAMFDADKGEFTRLADEPAPPHEPGLLPRWLGEKGVNLIIAGGMGGRTQTLFSERNIQVVVGAPADSPVAIVMQYLEGKLQTAANACTHGEGHVCDH